VKSSVARRGFLKAIGFAPAAVPLAGRALAEQALQQTMGGGVPEMPVGQPFGIAGGLSRWSAVGMAKSLWASLAKETDEKERSWRHAMAFRVGALEPDIAACKSWSHSFAARVQQQRDFEMADTLRRSRKRLYGWKDDWEE
jgi:hypothetical protein